MGGFFCRPSHSGRTLLGSAAFDGDVDRASKLITIDTDVNELCDDRWSAVALAAQQGHLDIVKLFLSKGADPDAGARTALVAACYAGKVDVIKYLIEQECNVNVFGEDRWSALTLACQEGHDDVIKLLLDHGADPDIGYQTALVSATLKRNMVVAKKLLSHGCNINALGDNRVSAVAAASQLGHTELVSLFLAEGADPDLGMRTALVASSCTGKADIVELLVTRGQNVNLLGEDRWSAVSIAAQGGHLDILKVLLDKGAQPDRGCQTALTSAALAGNMAIVQELLNHDCDINAISENKATAIAVSCQCGHLDIAKLLLSQGAQPTLGSRTALVAASQGGRLPVVKHLITCGHDVNAVGDDGWSAITLASQEGHIDVVRLLLANGANPDTGHQTALVSAALTCNLAIMKELVKHATDVNKLGLDNWSAVSSVSKLGRQDLIDYLLSQGADPVLGTRTAMATAAFNGHLEVVRALITKGVSTNDLGTDEWSAISLASEAGHLPIVQLLLANNAKPDIGCQPALVSACLKGEEVIAKELINNGADVNALTKSYLSAIAAASGRGHIDIVSVLLSHGANPDLGHGTALTAAALEGQLDIAEILLEHGSKVNEIGLNKTSAIAAASIKGHMDLVQLLLSKDADPTLGKDTALAGAALEGNVDIVKLLVEHGCDVNILGLGKMSALALACFNGHLDIVKYLLEKDAEPDIGDMNALGTAVAAGQREIVDQLIEHGADIDVVDEHGGTALVYAYRGGHRDLIKLLLELDADPDIGQWTPLVEASTGGHLEIVQELINDDGYDVNDLDGDGDSAICGAVYGGHLPVVKFLLEAGADPGLGANKTHFNEEGDTALGLSRRMGHKDIEEFLVSAGITE